MELRISLIKLENLELLIILRKFAKEFAEISKEVGRRKPACVNSLKIAGHESGDQRNLLNLHRSNLPRYDKFRKISFQHFPAGDDPDYTVTFFRSGFHPFMEIPDIGAVRVLFVRNSLFLDKISVG